MAYYRNPSVYLVASAAYYVDEQTRIDLSNNIVVNERDYVSNFTKGIRDFWKNIGFPSYSFSRTLNQNEENIFGCDGMIILKYHRGYKVCLFEAKYPRFSKNNYTWDKVNNNISHFSDQIHRQRNWTKLCAIWEMFIDEYPVKHQPNSLDDYGSTCVSHHQTDLYDRAYRNNAQAWTTNDIYSLLGTFKSKYRNVRYLLQRASQCYDGKILAAFGKNLKLKSNDNEHNILIPVDIVSFEESIPGFIEQYNLSDFLFIDFKNNKK